MNFYAIQDTRLWKRCNFKIVNGKEPPWIEKRGFRGFQPGCSGLCAELVLSLSLNRKVASLCTVSSLVDESLGNGLHGSESMCPPWWAACKQGPFGSNCQEYHLHG